MPVNTETPRVNNKHSPIERHGRPGFANPRKARRADTEQQANPNKPEDEAEKAAGQRERQALGEQLADDLPAAGAERGARGEFPLSG